MKFFRSLQAKYMLIILLAIFVVQIAYLLMVLFLTGIAKNLEKDGEHDKITAAYIEEKWHKEAGKIGMASKKNIEKLFANWEKEFPDAAMFWVDGEGRLASQWNVKEELPSEWTPAITAKFLKERYGGNPYTVVAFVGEDEQNGFVVFEIYRFFINKTDGEFFAHFGTILVIGTFVIILLFIIVSFLFFKGIRKRLLQLQDAMVIRDVDGLPIQIETKKKDEIGQLEQTFNTMVCELRESKQREEKEEQLRRELIASLSHDLRTPLTKLRAQGFSLRKETLSEEGKQSLQALEDSVVNIDRLIENLMSYSLLMASKYKYEAQDIDVIRHVRKILASWYSVFEKEGFEIEIELESFSGGNVWLVDPVWFERIFDNLLQNVLRHAKSGRYIGVKTETTDKYDALMIIDKGNGMESGSGEKGAGIGLSIVDMMVKGMKLDWLIDSSENGTTIKIIKYKQAAKLEAST